MIGMDRLESERAFHDRQAAERAGSFRAGMASLVFSDEVFLDHETWIRPALAKLGDLRGRCALDYGCGHGMAAVVMARAGAHVTAFDLSPGYIEEARARAIANRVPIQCTVADGEHLPFPDGSFDAVWGNAILHHLDLDRAGRELARVMKPGAIAVFCEPWGGNPLVRLARNWIPYPGKLRTPDEQPLTRRDLAPLRKLFGDIVFEGFQLLGMVRRAGVSLRLSGFLPRVDAALVRWVPPLGNMCRYAVIAFRRPAA